MMLKEIAENYLAEAELIKARIAELQKTVPGLCPELQLQMRRRIYILETMKRELRSTARYLRRYWNG